MNADETLGLIGLLMTGGAILWFFARIVHDTRIVRRQAAWERERDRQNALLGLWEAMVVTNAVQVARDEYERIEAERAREDETVAYLDELWELPTAPDGPSGPGLAA